MRIDFRRPAILFAAAAVGSLATWAIINWMPSITILAGGAGAVYIAWIKTSK